MRIFIAHLYEDSTMQRIEATDDVLEVHFIEKSKFLDLWKQNELNVLDDILIRWLLLLGMVDVRQTKVYNEIYQIEEGRLKSPRPAATSA